MDSIIQTAQNRIINEKKVGIWITIFSVVYISRDIIGLNFPPLVFTALFAFAFLTSTTEESLCYFIFSMALTLPSNEIRLVYLLLFLIKQRHIVYHFKAYNLLIILLLTNEMLVSFFYHSGSMWDYIYNLIIYSLYFLIPILWSQYPFTEKTIITAVKCLVASIVLVGVISIFLSVSSGGWAQLISGNNSLGITTSDDSTIQTMITSNNRNGLATEAAVAIALTLVLIATKHSNLIVSIIVVVLLLIVVLLTRSRTGVILVGFLYMYWILLISSRKGKKIQGIIVLCGTFIIVYGLYRFLPNAWNGVYGRFVNQTDITNGRIFLGKVYLEKWTTNWPGIFFGYGKNTYNALFNVGSPPHNMIVDILVCSGIFGLLCVLTWLLLFLRDCLINVSKTNRAYALLAPAACFFGMMAGQYFTTPMEHLMLSFLILSVAAVGNNSRKKVKGNSD